MSLKERPFPLDPAVQRTALPCLYLKKRCIFENFHEIDMFRMVKYATKRSHVFFHKRLELLTPPTHTLVQSTK